MKSGLKCSQAFWAYDPCISLLGLPGKVYPKCLEKGYDDIIEPKLEATQCGFRPGRSTTDQSSLSSNFSEKSYEYVKDVCICFVGLGKLTNEFFVKSFEKCCGSSVMRPPVTVRQVNVFLLKVCVRVGGVKSQPFTVDVGLRPSVCHHSSS